MGYGYNGYFSKRRRDFYEGYSYYYFMDENELLRRRIFDF